MSERPHFFNTFTTKWVMAYKKSLVQSLSKLVRSFNAEDVAQLSEYLNQINADKLGIDDLTEYYFALLFSGIYPANKEIKKQSSDKLKQLTEKIIKCKKEGHLVNSGLPGTQINASFSFALTRWIVFESQLPEVVIYSNASKNEIMELVSPFINTSKQEYLIEEHLTWNDWCDYLFFSKEHYLKDIILLISTSNVSASFKELVFKKLKIYVCFRFEGFVFPKDIKSGCSYYKNGLVKKVNLFDHLNYNKLEQLNIDVSTAETVAKCARINLLSFCRETDPITNTDHTKTKVFYHPNGVVICLFYLNKDHKLYHQEYVGYMMYKNNVPVAYGGGWIYKKQIRFGMNILPYGRGGESSLILADLIACYKQVFNPDLFLIDTYQIGKNNKEAIESGAFWFYYKFGFRSLSGNINTIAQLEFEKINSKLNYRTPQSILKKLSSEPVFITFKNGAEKKYIDISLLK